MWTLQDYLVSIGFFINDVILPFLFALALLFFIFNTARFFIIGGSEKKDEAKQLALYGIIAFVLLLSIWGIVNMISSSLRIDGDDEALCPDYLEKTGDCFNLPDTAPVPYNPFESTPDSAPTPTPRPS